MKLATTVLLLLCAVVGCTSPSDRLVMKEWAKSVDAPSAQSSYPQASDNPENRTLDSGTKTLLASYGSTIREIADEYDVDWRLVLAVMKQESRFLIDAQSYRGAQGLMQIMPETGEEVGKHLEIENVTQPLNNIRAGVYYLKKLYSMFEGVPEEDRIRLTLAAYNAGIGRIYDAQELAAYLNDNPKKWQSVRDALPLLSKRYYTLHKSVWSHEKPRAGWFGSARQTLAYVDHVMDYYDEYRLVLN